MNNTDIYLNKIEKALALCLPALPEEISGVSDMLAYSLGSGGKRIRPLLCLEFCAAVNGNTDCAVPFACAVEFVHTYSLIHDDLPCMDNDDYRRGCLSSHKKFGEANALLAGDALLTHAFFIISDAAVKGLVTSEQAVIAVRELSSLCGAAGMIGGQYMDMKYEHISAPLSALTQMDTLKTGALIEAACVLGIVAGGGNEADFSYARQYARELGLAFQIIDDVLENEDVCSSDIKKEKATYTSLFGVDKARKIAAVHTRSALEALNYFGAAADEIRGLTEALLNRKK